MLGSFVIGDGRRIRGDRAAAAANLTSRMNTSRFTGHASTVVPDDEVNVDERAVVGAAHDIARAARLPQPLDRFEIGEQDVCGLRLEDAGDRKRAVGRL